MGTPKAHWLRWVCFLPAAVIAAMLFHYFFFYVRLFFPREETSFTHYILPAISSFLSAYGFISVGAKVAPRHKQTVALILLILFMAMLFFSSYMHIINQQFDLLINLTGSVLGAVLTFYYIRKTERDYH